MRGTMMTGAAALALTMLAGCGGDDASEEIAATQAELAAAEAEAAQAEAPAPEAGSAAAEAYLAENAARDGVRVTDSGVQIETLTPGEGPSPTPQDILRIDYELAVANGEVLDSSERNGGPVILPGYEQLGMPGLIEAAPMLKEGERARITLPPALAFGEQVPPGAPVGPDDVVVFTISLVEVISPDDEARLTALQAEEQARQEAAREAMMAQMEEQRAANAAASEAFLAEKRAQEGVQTTESGLAYEVVEGGGEGEAPSATDRVRVHYRGTLPSGETFDSSYERGQPTEFGLDQVISGWTEGLQLMRPGETYRFYIPSDLAYGQSGTPGGPIGPDQALVFEVELLDVLSE